MVRFVIGIVLLLVAFVPLSLSAQRLRRAILPSWDGPPAWLADITIVIASLVGVTQVLGLLGIFRLVPVTIAYLTLSAGYLWLASRRSDSDDEQVPAVPSRLGRSGNLLAAVGVGLVAGPWTARASIGYTTGIPGADTLWYHLPAAARLVQTGSLRGIPHFDAGNLTAWYPNASTFFHATGMLFLESDILTPVINHGWVALALLAGWVIGRGFGVSAATMLAVSVAVSFPGFVGHEAGSAMNDVTGLALVLTSFALLMNARSDRLTSHLPVIALAASAAGLTLATKWTVVPTAAALTLGVLLLAERGHRLRVATTWLGFSAFAGLFTYARNWIHVGNPLPPIEISLGPITLDRVGSDDAGYASIAGWLFSDGAWSAVFRPGLDLWFGPLWAVVLALIAISLVVALFAGGSLLIRFLAAVGLVASTSYLFGPQFLEFFGQPLYFLSNLRYGIVAVGLGLVAAPLLPVLQRGRRVWIMPAAFVLLLVASTSSPGQWTGIADWRFQDPVGDGDTLVGVITAVIVGAMALVVVHASERIKSIRWSLVGPLLAVAALAIVVVAKPAYDEERFAEAPYWNPAVDLIDSRIALVGLNTQFMMYGDDLSNYVQWVGNIEDHIFSTITRCEDWVDVINAGRYTHALLGPANVDPDEPGPYQWMLADPGAVLVQEPSSEATFSFTDRDAVAAIAFFRIDAPLDVESCAV
jgi:hypothetical protein